jgi:hypothetical protein
MQLIASNLSVPRASLRKSPVNTGVCNADTVPPVFDKVIICAAVVWFTTVAAKVSDPGVNTIVAGAVPVPFSIAVICPPATFANAVSNPLRVPVAVGTNFNCTVHVAPTVSICPAQVLFSTKSPLTVRVLIFTGALPLLVMVSVCIALCVFTCCGPNVKLAAENVITGCTGLVADSSGVSQMPRPYVAARNMPFRPSPVGMFAAASSAIAGAFGRAIPRTLQQFTVGHVEICVVT